MPTTRKAQPVAPRVRRLVPQVERSAEPVALDAWADCYVAALLAAPAAAALSRAS